MYKLLLMIIIALLFSSCIEPFTGEDEGNEYTVQAYLTAGDTVKDIQVRKILRYVDFDQWLLDSLTKHSERLPHATVTLITGGEEIAVPVKELDSTYACGHRVIAGARYEIRVELFDEELGKRLTFTSETVIPTSDPSLKLNKDEMLLDTVALVEDYWSLGEHPELFDHLVLSGEENGSYRLLEFTPQRSRIFKVDSGGSVLMGVKQVPLQKMPRLITPLEIGFFGGYYEEYRLVVRQVQPEYADLYREEAKDKNYWQVIPTDIYAEGISNINGANGIFSGTATDTLNFWVKIKP